MATLILNANGTSPITVSCQRIGKAAYRYVGSKSYSFQGAERSSIRGQARIIPVLVSYVDTATEASIQAAIYNGAQIACSGDILGNIQTQCSVTCDKSDMIPGLPGFFEMALTVTEVQASVVLLKYAPGNTVTGEAFTRSTTGYQHDGSVLSSIAINTKRDSHYIGGVRSLILEDARTNSLIQASDLTQATWTKTRSSALKNATGPDGAVNSASTLTEDATATSSHFTSHAAITITTLTVQSVSGYFKAGARTRVQLDLNSAGGDLILEINLGAGTVTASGTGGASVTNSGIVLLGNGWYRVWISGTFAAATTATLFLFLENAAGATSYSGDGASGVLMYGLQHEVDKPFPSSFIATTTVAVTRGADAYSLPFTYPPQEMTVYAKLVEGGTLQASKYVYQISNAADALPQSNLAGGAGFYGLTHNNNVSPVTSILAQAPSLGNTVELMAHLFADGSVDLSQSINGATATAGSQSAALAFASAWAGQLLWLNSATATTGIGFTALQSFKIVSGCRSLVEMRAI